jgi:hypothetical protein
MTLEELRNVSWVAVAEFITARQSEFFFVNHEHQIGKAVRTPATQSTTWYLMKGSRELDSLEELLVAINERGEQPKRHPGYIMGEHWLQAAYTRICTGETEAEVMSDYGWRRESR